MSDEQSILGEFIHHDAEASVTGDVVVLRTDDGRRFRISGIELALLNSRRARVEAVAAATHELVR